jgi:hypothetical protein
MGGFAIPLAALLIGGAREATAQSGIACRGWEVFDSRWNEGAVAIST